MSEDKMRHKIVLAALLHDIGKFWQRADVKLEESAVISNYYTNKRYDVNVPVYENGHPKYAHALWTNAFILETRTGNKLGLNNDSDVTLANLSSNHHKPNNHMEAILSIADKWSSGIDRPDEGEEGVANYAQVKKEYGDEFIKKVQLHSIFNTIHKEFSDISIYHSFPLKALTIDEIIIPTEEQKQFVSQDYKALWDSFYNEYLGLLNSQTNTAGVKFRAYYTSLMTLLKKYTWCIPSATNLLPACVSLYEHLKSTAAISLSLYDYMESNNSQYELINHRVSNPSLNDALLMVCVDVSGIQKFIYDISNRRAAVSLKGRSFYLEILIRNVLNEILEHPSIDAFESNIIYASGGKAYLILPNLERVKKALSELQDKLAKVLFKETQGKLFISIGYTSFRYETHFGNITKGRQVGKKGFVNLIKTDDEDILEQYATPNNPQFNLSMLWRSVSDKAAQSKNTRFKNIFEEQYETLFLKGEDFEAYSQKCSVTGEWIEGKIQYLYPDADDSNKGPVSSEVYKQIQLGKELKSSAEIKYHDRGDYDTLSLNQPFSVAQVEDRYVVNKSISINNWPDFSQKSYAKGHIFYGGNYQPTIVDKGNERPKTFEELCYKNHYDVTQEQNGVELTKLGILRMDVDNLGQIFINGIKEPSFAAYATLSMMLDTFFSGFINTLQSEDDRFKNHLQVLYSGGDDVFAIGRWDVIIDFGDKLRDAFRSYTKRDDITLSAGIAIVNAKYPIYKAAEEAGVAEKKAKDYKSMALGDKNAICLFDEAISWEQEWPMIKELKNTFLKNLSATGTGLLHAIQSFKMRKDNHYKNLKDGKSGDLSYIWHSGYQLSRMMDRIQDNEAKSLIKLIRDNIYHNKAFGAERYLDLASVAARWAELLNKFNKS